MSSDKCPKCGAKRDGIHGRPHYLCGSWNEGHGLEQSEECKLRVELVELKDRHAKLVEAARRVSSDYICGKVDVSEGKERPEQLRVHGNFIELKRLLEREPANG